MLETLVNRAVDFVVAETQTVLFDLENPPYSTVKVIAGKFMATINLPINDLDMTVDNSAEINARFRNIYRKGGEHHDLEGIRTGETFKAGRQSISRKLELAHELLTLDGAMHVWAGMHPRNAKAIETAILKWHDKPVVTTVTGSERAANLHDEGNSYDPNPKPDAVRCLVRRRFANARGFINEVRPKIAILDIDSDVLYFDDYIASAGNMVEGFEERETPELDKYGQIIVTTKKGDIKWKKVQVAVYRPALEIHTDSKSLNDYAKGRADEYLAKFSYEQLIAAGRKLHQAHRKLGARKGFLTYMKRLKADIAARIQAEKPLIIERVKAELEAEFKYCLANWYDAKHEQAMLNTTPANRKFRAWNIADLKAFEIRIQFDEMFEQRLAEMAEDARLERMTLIKSDDDKRIAIVDGRRVYQFKSEEQKDEYEAFEKLAKETTNGFGKPIVKCNAKYPGPWSITPKGAKVKLAKFSVDRAIVAFWRRERHLAAIESNRPMGRVQLYTPYHRAAHDERSFTMYIGQTWAKQKGNPLANGPIGDKAFNQDWDAKNYSKWLWDAIKLDTPAGTMIKQLAAHIKSGQHLTLVAWPMARKGTEKRGLPAPQWAEIVLNAVKYQAAQM